MRTVAFTRSGRPTLILFSAVITIGVLATPARAVAQSPAVPLWPNGAPGSENWTQKEVGYGGEGNPWVRNVVQPTLTAFLPKAGTGSGASVIIAPGGAFNHLAVLKEGTQVAQWLQSRGVAGFVLKYRLMESGPEVEAATGSSSRGGGRSAAPAGAPSAGRSGRGSDLSPIQALAAADGLQAIRVVREHAKEWGLDREKIGIIGFSAGGYVAVKAALEHDASTRPNFAGAIYTCCVQSPVTVPADAPPLFIASAYNDPVSITASPALLAAWKSANKVAEIHIYSAGGHGFGMTKQNLPSDRWIERFGDWLRFQELMK